MKKKEVEEFFNEVDQWFSTYFVVLIPKYKWRTLIKNSWTLKIPGKHGMLLTSSFLPLGYEYPRLRMDEVEDCSIDQWFLTHLIQLNP